MSSSLRFDNCIFDLYGTLIDIRTDETDLSLWKTMSSLYRTIACDYTPASMRAAYRRIWKQTEQEMKKNSGMEFPEVDAVEVFRKLGSVSRKTVPTSDSATSDLKSHDQAGENSPDRASGTGCIFPASGSSSDWYTAAASVFRILSRKKMRLYPGTLETLRTLTDAGAHLYLLSNAQHVYTMPEIRECGLLPYFDGIMISSDEEIRKPQPDYMERLLSRYHLDRDRSVMIGNEPGSDIRIALACGMHSILLNTGHLSAQQIRDELHTAVAPVPAPLVIPTGRIIELPPYLLQ